MMKNDRETLATLARVSTATITTLLLKRGLRQIWMRGPTPLRGGQPKPVAGQVVRQVGPAFTMRFVPVREDLATPASWNSPRSTRAAIEEMPAGCIVVVDAMGVTTAGIFGDILCARMRQRGVHALVTDGAIRDAVGVEATGLPVWCRGVAAPPSIAALTFVDWQQPVGCGGVAVFPDDLIVADGDGAVVVPRAMIEEVCTLGPEQEQLEQWIIERVEDGESLPGLYPPSEAQRARYRNSRGLE
jgi:regulator of RNase E activity RraA